MADDTLASERTLEQPSDNGQAGRESEAQPQSDTGGQTSDNGKSAQDENIRKLQSTYDKKLAEQDRAYKSQMQQQQQMIQSLQQQMREAQRNSAPDDYSKLELELQWAKQEAQQYANAYQQAVAERQQQTERESALREIADEFDVPMSALTDATDYKSAVKLAIKAQQEAQRRKQQQDDDKSARNMPDIGSGAPRTASSQAEAEWEELVRTRDSVGQARWLRLHGGKR